MEQIKPVFIIFQTVYIIQINNIFIQQIQIIQRRHQRTIGRIRHRRILQTRQDRTQSIKHPHPTVVHRQLNKNRPIIRIVIILKCRK